MMSPSRWVCVILLAGTVGLSACNPFGSSEPPFPVENQTEWKRYLQGTWVYGGMSPSGAGLGQPVDDSLFLRITFRGDTLDYVGETHQGDWMGKRETTCAVEYGAPYTLEVTSCVRGLELRRDGTDTLQTDSFSVSPESPRSRKMAYAIGRVFPPSLRALSVDSLWIMERNGTEFSLIREEDRD